MTFEPDYYSISIRKELHDGEQYYVGRVAEFPNIGVFESSPSEAYSLVVDAISTLHDIALKSGQDMPVPFPAPQDEFSGRVTLRLPRTLHAKVSAYANYEDCSVNTFLVSIISAAVGEKNIKSKVKSSNKVYWVVSDIDADNLMSMTSTANNFTSMASAVNVLTFPKNVLRN